MKKYKKIIALALVLVLVCAGSVFATAAYLTAKDSILNTFTVGDVDLKLDETLVDEDGVAIKDNNDEIIKTETGNEYHLIPGMTYTKDPTVTVTKESDDSYIRMIVTISNYNELIEVFGSDFLPENYVQGWDKTIWIPNGQPVVNTADNTVAYEFRYKDIVETMGDTEDLRLPALFTSFTMPTDLDGDDLAKLKDLEIAVDAHAVQAATFDNADAAWAAFDAQYATAP